ncbi:hypothetical protein TSOC_009301 [Tetrabaena socialis]|uniref:Uncharacterized protein n=1 Tax=Tetrabaena socialis TaxID=47790 RepID=A0A2J7ZW76_9CHLO|nr:hypothetical protein TSOC_009301 [Tetrabaena socialis]|eukprot:PNH04527.1 hypothetical protein TSOC_009301 [Tetrabaena socialis]
MTTTNTYRAPLDVESCYWPGRNSRATVGWLETWVKAPEDFVDPWRVLPGSGSERWALVWESEVLQSLGWALRRFIRDKAIEESSKMVVRLSLSTGEGEKEGRWGTDVVAGVVRGSYGGPRGNKAVEESSKMVVCLSLSTALVTAMMLPALITAMMLPMAVLSAINMTIGSRWRVALRRAQLAGRCLAHMLMQGAHGDRPVTLPPLRPLLKVPRSPSRCSGEAKLSLTIAVNG